MHIAMTREFTFTVQPLFDQIANSEVFRAAPVMRTLLIYLWEHQGEAVNEYAIAVDGLGRPPDFDPKADATVRVQIARLRAKLKEFYANENEAFALQLEVPRGGHELQWTRIQLEPSAPLEPSVLSTYRPRQFPYLGALAIALGVAVVILATVGILLFGENRSLRSSLPPPAPQLPRFWKSFLGGSQRTSIVLPSPVYFIWTDKNVVVRDLGVSSFQDWSTSPVIRELAEKLGPPSLLQMYVSGLDLDAGVRVLEFLKKYNKPVELIQSRNLSAESVNMSSVIYLGIPRTVGYLKQVLEKTNFYMASPQPSVVWSRKPAPGESPVYRRVDFSDQHKIYPGLIVLLPPTPDGNRTLILMGMYPMAFTSMLLSQGGLQQLDDKWRKTGAPDSWELVVQAEVNGETILKAWPESMRAIPANFWK